MSKKRFVIVDMDDKTPSVTLADETRVSHHVDMEDCFEFPYFLFYVTDKGTIAPVSVEGFKRINLDEEMPFRYAMSDLMAEGEVVGHVIHTDH